MCFLLMFSRFEGVSLGFSRFCTQSPGQYFNLLTTPAVRGAPRGFARPQSGAQPAHPCSCAESADALAARLSQL
jgi:hypothetical protein